jgi:hypothetical protein
MPPRRAAPRRTLQFSFQAPGREPFACTIACQQCAATTAAGARCRARTCIGLPVCWQHLARQYRVAIRASTIPGGGKGLFAADPRAAPGTLVFRRGDIIVPYGSERVTRDQLTERYGEYTAPYGIHVSGTTYENGACARGAGSLANHAPRSRANAEYSTGRNAEGQWYSRLRATKGIRNGSEILSSYGPQYVFDEPTTYSTTRKKEL